MTPQPDYTYLFGHLAKSVKKINRNIHLIRPIFQKTTNKRKTIEINQCVTEFLYSINV